jgi:hypothetical protein
MEPRPPVAVAVLAGRRWIWAQHGVEVAGVGGPHPPFDQAAIWASSSLTAEAARRTGRRRTAQKYRGRTPSWARPGRRTRAAAQPTGR